MNLRDRIAALESATTAPFEPLTEAQLEHLANSLPNDVLRHYLQGDLDEQAARLEAIDVYLRSLAEDGQAIEVDGHWHPLFIGDDADVNEQVLTRVKQLLNDQDS